MLTGLHDSKLEERCFCSISVLLYFMVLLLLDHHPLSLYVIKWKSKLRNVHSIRTTSYFVLLSAEVFFWKFIFFCRHGLLSIEHAKRTTHTCWMVMMLLITMKMWLTLLPSTFAVKTEEKTLQQNAGKESRRNISVSYSLSLKIKSRSFCRLSCVMMSAWTYFFLSIKINVQKKRETNMTCGKNYYWQVCVLSL